MYGLTQPRRGAGIAIIPPIPANCKEEILLNATLLETINQKCEGTVRYGKAPQEIISTGLSQLDAAAGGGIPRGKRVVVVWRLYWP